MSPRPAHIESGSSRTWWSGKQTDKPSNGRPHASSKSGTSGFVNSLTSAFGVKSKKSHPTLVIQEPPELSSSTSTSSSRAPSSRPIPRQQGSPRPPVKSMASTVLSSDDPEPYTPLDRPRTSFTGSILSLSADPFAARGIAIAHLPADPHLPAVNSHDPCRISAYSAHSSDHVPSGKHAATDAGAAMLPSLVRLSSASSSNLSHYHSGGTSGGDDADGISAIISVPSSAMGDEARNLPRNGHVETQQPQRSPSAADLATDSTIDPFGRQTHHPHNHTLYASGSSFALRESTLVPWAEASASSTSASSRKMLVRPRCNTDAGITRPQRLLVEDFPMPPLPVMPPPPPPQAAATITTRPRRAESASSPSAKAPPPSLPPLIIRPPAVAATVIAAPSSSASSASLKRHASASRSGAAFAIVQTPPSAPPMHGLPPLPTPSGSEQYHLAMSSATSPSSFLTATPSPSPPPPAPVASSKKDTNENRFSSSSSSNISFISPVGRKTGNGYNDDEGEERDNGDYDDDDLYDSYDLGSRRMIGGHHRQKNFYEPSPVRRKVVQQQQQQQQQQQLLLQPPPPVPTMLNEGSATNLGRPSLRKAVSHQVLKRRGASGSATPTAPTDIGSVIDDRSRAGASGGSTPNSAVNPRPTSTSSSFSAAVYFTAEASSLSSTYTMARSSQQKTFPRFPLPSLPGSLRHSSSSSYLGSVDSMSTMTRRDSVGSQQQQQQQIPQSPPQQVRKRLFSGSSFKRPSFSQQSQPQSQPGGQGHVYSASQDTTHNDGESAIRVSFSTEEVGPQQQRYPSNTVTRPNVTLTPPATIRFASTGNTIAASSSLPSPSDSGSGSTSASGSGRSPLAPLPSSSSSMGTSPSSSSHVQHEDECKYKPQPILSPADLLLVEASFEEEDEGGNDDDCRGDDSFIGWREDAGEGGSIRSGLYGGDRHNRPRGLSGASAKSTATMATSISDAGLSPLLMSSSPSSYLPPGFDGSLLRHELGRGEGTPAGLSPPPPLPKKSAERLRVKNREREGLVSSASRTPAAAAATTTTTMPIRSHSLVNRESKPLARGAGLAPRPSTSHLATPSPPLTPITPTQQNTPVVSAASATTRDNNEGLTSSSAGARRPSQSSVLLFHPPIPSRSRSNTNRASVILNPLSPPPPRRTAKSQQRRPQSSQSGQEKSHPPVVKMPQVLAEQHVGGGGGKSPGLTKKPSFIDLDDDDEDEDDVNGGVHSNSAGDEEEDYGVGVGAGSILSDNNSFVDDLFPRESRSRGSGGIDYHTKRANVTGAPSLSSSSSLTLSVSHRKCSVDSDMNFLDMDSTRGSLDDDDASVAAAAELDLGFAGGTSRRHNVRGPSYSPPLQRRRAKDVYGFAYP